MKRIFISFILFLGLAASLQSQNSLQNERIDSLLYLLETNNKMMVSVSVSQKNETTFEKATGFAVIETKQKADIATKYRIGSISKMYTSVMIFQLIDEGKLTLDEPLSAFFSEIPDADKITINMLLRHRSGIFNFTNDSIYETYNTEAKSHAEMLSIITNHPIEFEPDSKSEYSNSNYVLLGYIIEKITGKDYSSNLKDRITDPLGLKSTYYGDGTNLNENECYSYHFEEGKWIKNSETDLSVPGGAGALLSTPTEINTFIQAIFNDHLISEQSKTEMIRLQDHFGCGIFNMPFYDKKGLGHTGGIDGFRSMTVYYPQEEVAVSLCSNGNNYSTNELLIGILSIVFGREYKFPDFKVIAINPIVLASYVGVYAAEGFPLKIEITLKKDQVFAQATGQSAFPLEAVDETNFKFDAAGIKIKFSENELNLQQGGMDFKLSKQP
ncbi:MAG: serine hydrolase domain-containing protein [Ignavibacteria bacterium]|nr:serine hydrolase domain-containing protein [Ignavibacteria bacterium]